MARIIETPRRRPGRNWLRPALAGVTLALVSGAGAAPGPKIHALLVGGGPDKDSNTAQIEEHLRFVTSLVPASPGRVLLFADGKASSRNLSYTDTAGLSPGQQALDVLLPDDDLGAKVQMRAPSLGAPLDGPSREGAIERAFHRLAEMSGKDSPPVLIYFAGHGSTADDKNKTSLYDLWGDEDLDPETLLRDIDLLPTGVPVTLVMAQCFSGGFGNVLFKDADPDGALNQHLIVGFFASEPDREAAGCGTDTDSPLYQDFSSYFFGALSGRDKLGHTVVGADYDENGRVSCYDAWCYAMIHDDSIDTPVSTSLVFLRHFADVPDETIYTTGYQSALASATPAEKAVLEALSARLALDGEQRILAAFDRLMFADPIGQPGEIHEYRDAQDRLNTMRMADLQTLFQKWPALRWRDSDDYNRATHGAAQDLDKDATKCQQLISTRDEFDRADAALDNEEALLVRFTDVVEMIVRRRWLREHGDAPTKARFEQLWRAEQQPLGIATGR
jgi:hypothetical protein